MLYFMEEYLMTNEFVQGAKEKMTKTIGVLKDDYACIRAGRANPTLIQRITVNYYGTPTPIPQVGNIAVPEARMVTITPWDSTLIKEIEKGILASDLGITPSNDGKIIRIIFPELTAERRSELVRQCKKKAEDSKVALRSIRRDLIEKLEKEEKVSNITEDDLKDLKTEAQKLTDENVKLIDDICREKEAEITKI